jgi:hypothetical protein
MSIKSKILAGAATLALAGGVATAGALTAGAATPSCGPKCIDVFSKNFGTSATPQYVMDVLRQGAKVGQPVILFRTSNSDPAEDFTVSVEGQVSDFYAANLISPSLALHYGCINGLVGGTSVHCSVNPLTGQPSAVDDYAFEVEYAPYGVDSGLCVGTGATAVQNGAVSLQPCGVTARTVWVADTLDSCTSNPLYSGEIPVINGSDTNFSHPYVLTYPASGEPTDRPRPQLRVNNLTGFSQTGGTGSAAACGGSAITGPDSNQLWSADAGVLP